MGSAIWPPRLESWLGCAICEQRERPPSRVGVVLKRSMPENCPKARRPSFCEKISRVATPLLATMALPRNLHLRSLSVRQSAIRCFYCRASCNWKQSHLIMVRFHLVEGIFHECSTSFPNYSHNRRAGSGSIWDGHVYP